MHCKHALLFIFLFFQAVGYANNSIKHPFYAGFLGGYGSTTWRALVPSRQNQNFAINISTPIDVKEGGQAWGLWAGYEFGPYFALETNYIHYAPASVTFDEVSLFSFNNGTVQFTTQTQSLSLMGKIMLQIPNLPIRVYSGAGIAKLYRKDLIINDSMLTPTFSVGVNFHLSDNIMSEIASNYIAGFGESQLNPTNSFYPFVYSVTYRIAYCF